MVYAEKFQPFNRDYYLPMIKAWRDSIEDMYKYWGFGHVSEDGTKLLYYTGHNTYLRQAP